MTPTIVTKVEITTWPLCFKEDPTEDAGDISGMINSVSKVANW